MPFRVVRSRLALFLAIASPAILAAALLPSAGFAAPPDHDARHWIRYPAISPDGATIAFSWRGDLWIVPVAGGEATALTSHQAYEAWPVWSPDSRRIAFASDRHGQLDVFLVDATGGTPTRLTYHSADDIPSDFSSDGSRIFFESDRQHAPQALLGQGAFPELYSTATDGSGRPRQEVTTPVLEANLSVDDGRVVYEDRTAYENSFRKHQTSSAARDIWSWDRASGRHQKLTDFIGDDRDPLWTADGSGVVYLSEQDGTLDIWRFDLSADGSKGEPEQVTQHGPHPVRFLTQADDGILAYGYHGAVWVRGSDGESRQVPISLRADERANRVERSLETSGATEMAASPLGDEVAFILRGEIFVASVEHGTTRRLTETAEQERSLSWAPNGRSVYFASERGGSWNLYQISLVHDDEERFFLATETAESPVLVTADETFQPVASPDGNSLAYLSNRDEIRRLDLASGESKVLVPSERNYSYSDGDISYLFSPDGGWLAATYYGHKRWIDEIALVNLASGEIHNVSDSGYSESGPAFAADGESLFFVSDRYGQRSHGSWGGEADVMAVSLNRAAWDRAQMSLEDWERVQKAKRKEKGKGNGDDGDEEEEDDGNEAEPKLPDPVPVDVEGFDDRTRRMTFLSADLEAYVPSKDGEAVFFLAAVDDKPALWGSHARKGETRRLADLGGNGGTGGGNGGGSLELSKDGETLFVLTADGRLMQLDVESFTQVGNGNGGGKGGDGGGRGGGGGLEAIPFHAELTYDSVAERRHMFEHVWRQVREKFYVADLHGADWEFLKQEYEPLVDDLRHGRDFAELLSELLGELNASHTGGRYRPSTNEGDATASLGLLYDPSYEGPGLKVAAVLDRGPADRADSRIEPGTLLTHIGGVRLGTEVNPWALLNHRESTKLRIGLSQGGESWEEVIEPVTDRDESRLRYERWIDRLRAMTDELSGGRVGYVHVASMNDRSFRRFYQDALGPMSDKEALVVDTRWNGGGWLHDDLAAFLQGELYLTFVPRGKEPGSFDGESMMRWTRPSVVLQNEANYSDGHISPWVIQHLGLAPLVGAPVAGTGTAVWWERLMDGVTVFGIPQVGMLAPDGRYMENTQLEPDIEVYNSPESVARGEDSQLAAAVALLLERLARDPRSLASRP